MSKDAPSSSKNASRFQELWIMIDQYIQARIPTEWIDSGPRARGMHPIVLGHVAKNPYSDATKGDVLIALSWGIMIDRSDHSKCVFVEAELRYDSPMDDAVETSVSLSFETEILGHDIYAQFSFPNPGQGIDSDLETIFAHVQAMIDALHQCRWPKQWREE